MEQARQATEETRRAAFSAAREAEFNRTLDRMQVDGKRRDTLRKLVDLDDVKARDEAGLTPDTRQIQRAVSETFRVMPEAFGEGARPLRVNAPDVAGPNGPHLRGRLTRDQIEAMEPEEINRDWDRVQEALASDR